MNRSIWKQTKGWKVGILLCCLLMSARGLTGQPQLATEEPILGPMTHPNGTPGYWMNETAANLIHQKLMERNSLAEEVTQLRESYMTTYKGALEWQKAYQKEKASNTTWKIVGIGGIILTISIATLSFLNK